MHLACLCKTRWVRCQSLTPVRGRMQPIHEHPAGARIIIDFAHTPDALEAALIALRDKHLTN